MCISKTLSPQRLARRSWSALKLGQADPISTPNKAATASVASHRTAPGTACEALASLAFLSDLHSAISTATTTRFHQDWVRAGISSKTGQDRVYKAMSGSPFCLYFQFCHLVSPVLPAIFRPSVQLCSLARSIHSFIFLAGQLHTNHHHNRHRAQLPPRPTLNTATRPNPPQRCKFPSSSPP